MEGWGIWKTVTRTSRWKPHADTANGIPWPFLATATQAQYNTKCTPKLFGWPKSNMWRGDELPTGQRRRCSHSAACPHVQLEKSRLQDRRVLASVWVTWCRISSFNHTEIKVLKAIRSVKIIVKSHLRHTRQQGGTTTHVDPWRVWQLA